jgi:hypothetical protein
MATPHSSRSFWAINAPLFDYRTIIDRAIITVKGDYRKTGRLSTTVIDSNKQRMSSA